MAGCEKCWGDAHLRSITTGKSQVDCYFEILIERQESGKICTPEEQAGQFWDEVNQCDSRFMEKLLIDDVGGQHYMGAGWNPNGVWCGECTRESCKGCVNEFKE